MTYAELGAALPRSGGEYNFLARIYHPAAGFISGWVSVTIGFAAPTALAAITFAAYATSALPGESSDALQKALACGLVVALTLVHASTRRNSAALQVIFTILKVGVIVSFCIAAVMFAKVPQPVQFWPAAGDSVLLTSSAFAVSLIYVSYAYTGWNVATYLSSEVENPQRTLPGILMTGTLVVMLLYVALNFVFLWVAPMDAMAGQIEVGYIAARSAFGDVGGRFTGLVLALLLVSTVSAMTLAGPRVLQVIGLFILTSSFESILVFAGFTLALNSFATVLGVFVLRWRQPDLPRPYRTFAYPLTPLIYLALTGWTLTFVLINKPVEGLFGLGIISAGLLFYFLSAARNRGCRATA
jgi:APA family basic amino acid/polyamine antiporter